MKKLKGTFCLYFIVVIFLCTTVSSITLSSPYESSSVQYEKVLGEFNLDNVKEHVKALSSFNTRVTGYEGYYKATEYIVEHLRKYAQVYLHEYEIVVPIDKGSYLKVETTNETIRIYPLWPNLVETSPVPKGEIEDLKLVYVADGDLSSLSVDVNNTVVLIEFNSGYNWVKLAALGVRAFIFIQPYETTSYEALSKQLLIPLKVPRFYILREDAIHLRRLLLQGEVRVSLTSSFRFETKKVYNIIGVLRGVEKVNETIVLGTHYDTWSIVPSVAPGAEDAIGAAFLLELARVLNKTGTYRSVCFLFVSGHWEGLAGSREFVESLFFKNETFGLRPYLVMFFDISSGSDKLGIFYGGNFYGRGVWRTGAYGGGGIERYMTGWLDTFITDIAKTIAKKLKLTKVEEKAFIEKFMEKFDMTSLSDTSYLDTIPYRAFFDVEPFTMATFGLTFQIHTIYDIRPRVLTPLDLPKFIKWNNVREQLVIAASLGYGLVVDENLPKVFPSWEPLESERRERVFYVARGFVKLIGQVVKHNFTAPGFYDPVPNALVLIVKPENMYLPFLYIIARANNSGIFVVNGLMPSLEAARGTYLVKAYVMNEEKGGVIYAPDMGPYGAGKYSNIIVTNEPIKGLLKPVPTVVFKTSQVVLYNVKFPLASTPTAYFNVMFEPAEVLHPPGALGPYTALGGPIGMTVGGAATIMFTRCNVYESGIGTEPWYYGWDYDVMSNIMIVYIQKGKPYDIVLRGQTPLGTEETFLVLQGVLSRKVGEIKVVPFTELRIVENLYKLNKERLNVLKSYRVALPIIVEEFSKGEEYLKKAKEALSEGKYSEYAGYIYLSWAYMTKTYTKLINNFYSAGTSAVFLMALIIPFAFLVERLIFEERRVRRRLTIILIITVSAYAIMYTLHPGFYIVANAVITVLGYSVLILSLPIVFLIITSGLEIARAIQLKEKGMHIFERTRVETLITTFALGASNMRRRRLRTILSLISIILVVFALTSLTSLTYIVKPTWQEYSEGVPTYTGILIKSPILSPISETTIRVIETLTEGKAIISKRIFYYPASMIPGISEPATLAFYNNKSYEVYAILALPPEEEKVSKITSYCAYPGTFFTEESRFAVIISDRMARELLGVEDLSDALGKKINIMGWNLTVVNVFREEGLIKYLKDLDGTPVVPIDTMSYVEYNRIVPLSKIVIVPASLVEGMPGANTRSLAVRIEDENLIQKVTEELVRIYSDTIVYASVKNKVYMMTRVELEVVMGLESALVPLILASLILLNAMLGSIYERTREIGIYSSLGLSPAFVSFMFLAELLIYAIVGSLIGYLTGIVWGGTLTLLNLMPEGVVLNYSSSFIVVSMGLLILATISASIYPLSKSAKLVTPSIERKWKIRTKPVGTRWSIPLPVKIDPNEIYGIMLYIKEFFDMNRVPATGNFYVDRLAEIKEGVSKDLEVKEVVTQTYLPPWGSGLKQEVRVQFVRKKGLEKAQYDVLVQLNLLQGARETWIRSNYRFVNELRKQLILWRSLRTEDRLTYLKRGRELIGGESS